VKLPFLYGPGGTGEAVVKGNGRCLMAYAIDGRGTTKEGGVKGEIKAGEL
jgi:hypothetical protein